MRDDSPLKELRLKIGMSQRKMVAESDLSLTAVVYAEGALYEQIPMAVRIALTRAMQDAGFDYRRWLQEEYGVEKLNDAMRIWQRSKRRHTGLTQGLDLAPPMPLDHLIAMWPNPDRFAKDLCIPPSAVHQYRAGDVHSVPEIISTALSEAGYRHQALTMGEWQKRSFPPRPA